MSTTSSPRDAAGGGAPDAGALRLAIAAVLPDAVLWDWDVEARTVWWSAALERFGYPAAEVDGGRGWWSARLHDEERERVLAGLAQAVDGRAEAWSAEYRFRRADGSFALVRDGARVLRAADGRARRLIGVMADVTERRDLEVQLADATRTAAVARLTGGLAHDLNNLLTVIGGRVHIMRERPGADDALRRDLDVIARTVDRVAVLARQLQAVSGRPALEPKPLDLNAVVAGVLPLVSRLLGGDVAARLEPGLARVTADQAHLEHLLLELAAAAREALAPGGRLAVTTANVDAEAAAGAGDPPAGPAVLLAIGPADAADGGAGPGAGPGRARGSGEASPKPPRPSGRGAGAGPADALARRMGGRVSVSVEADGRPRVALYLPRAAAVRRAAAELAAAGAPARPGETVLLVDSDDDVRALARDTLAALGYGVVEARDVDEALAVSAAPGRIDLLVVEQVMPRMSGRVLAHRVLAARPGTAVLYLAGHPPSSAASGSGPAVLPKPLAPADLARAVRGVLDARP